MGKRKQQPRTDDEQREWELYKQAQWLKNNSAKVSPEYSIPYGNTGCIITIRGN